MDAVIWWMPLRKQEHRLRRIKKGIRDFPNKNAFVATNAYLAIYIPATCLANNTKNEEGDCIEKEQQGYYKACTSYRK